MCFRSARGFTIVELLVVIAIIMLLTSLGFAGFISSLKASRDTKRQTEVRDIAKGLEFIFGKTGSYPESGPNPANASCANIAELQEYFTPNTIPTGADLDDGYACYSGDIGAAGTNPGGFCVVSHTMEREHDANCTTACAPRPSGFAAGEAQYYCVYSKQ